MSDTTILEFKNPAEDLFDPVTDVLRAGVRLRMLWN